MNTLSVAMHGNDVAGGGSEELRCYREGVKHKGLQKRTLTKPQKNTKSVRAAKKAILRTRRDANA